MAESVPPPGGREDGASAAASACPLCGSTRHRKDYDFSDSRAPATVPGLVVSCRSCGLRFKIPARPEIPLADYYADATVYRDRDDVAEAAKEFAQIIDAAAQLAAPGARLLDIGSGPGHFLGAAMRAGFRATGVEINPELARIAAQSSGAEVVVGDGTALRSVLAGRERSFDVVTLLDVVEHVSDPVALLRDAGAFVAPGGALLVYTPNHSGLIARTAALTGRLSGGLVDGPLRGIYDCDHVVFFDPASLRDAVRRAGLRDGAMTMIRFNPDRRGIARGLSAHVLRALESLSPWIGGEFRMLLAAHID